MVLGVVFCDYTKMSKLSFFFLSFLFWPGRSWSVLAYTFTAKQGQDGNSWDSDKRVIYFIWDSSFLAFLNFIIQPVKSLLYSLFLPL